MLKVYTNLIPFDKKHMYSNNTFNKKNITFFFFNKKNYLINNNNFKKHGDYQNWKFFCSRLFGFNKKLLIYILPFLGYNKNIFYTDTDETYFIFFKYFLKYYCDFFTLSWFLIYLKQRVNLLPLLIKGIRFIKKLPCRGQRTHSNYHTSKKKKTPKFNLLSFKKKLNKRTLLVKFPNWKQIDSFYFHRF